MPTYTVIAQRLDDPEGPSRAPRNLLHTDVENITVEATNISQALLKVVVQLADDTSLRIVSVEEVIALDSAIALTDDELVAALDNPDTYSVRPDQYEDGAEVLTSGDLVWTISNIADALSESETVPGLSITVVDEEEVMSDMLIIEIHDSATSTYRSAARSTGDIVAGSTLTGWAAVLFLARSLIQIVSDERLA